MLNWTPVFTVHLSARLMSKANWGILCDKDTKEHTEASKKTSPIRFDDMGSVQVKGKAMKVRRRILCCCEPGYWLK